MRKILLLLGIPTILIFIPFLLFGRTFISTDTVQFTYPALEFMKTHWLSGIDPYLYMGFPWATSFHYAYFNPVALLVTYLFDYVYALGIIQLFNFILSAIFAYLFFKEWGLEKDSSVFAAMIFVFCQSSTFWLSSLTVTNTLFLTPTLAFVALKLSARKYGYGLFLPLVLGYAFLSGHYQFIVMSFVVSSCILLYKVQQKFDKNKTLLANLTPLLVYFAGLCVGIFIGLPQIWSTLGSFGYITRHDFIFYSYLQPLDLLRFVFPFWNIYKLNDQEFLPYIGIIPLVLIIFLFVDKNKIKKDTLFAGVMYVFFISFSIKYMPTAFISEHLPIFKYFNQPVRWIYVANIFPALLAGVGLEKFRKEKDAPSGKKVGRYAIQVACWTLAALSVINLSWIVLKNNLLEIARGYFDSHLYANTSHLPLEYYHDLIRVMADGTFSNLSLLNPYIWIFLISLAALYFMVKYTSDDNRLQLYIYTITVCGFMASFFFSVQTGNMAMIKDRPILIGYMQSLEPNAFSYRVFSYQIPESQYREISALHPDKTKEIARYGIEGLAGNNNQVQLVGGLEANGDKKIQKVIFDELLPYSEDFSPKIPILSTLNAKYIISPEKIADSSLLLSTTTTVTSFEVPLYLYENKDVLPRVRLAKDVIFLKENADDANYRSIFHSGADLLNTTFIECNDCQNAKIKPSPSDQITSLVMEDEKTEFRTKTRSDSWVIIANGNVLGWQAFLDGKPVPIYRADYILQGLYLPAGEHKIELIFKQ